MTFDERRDIALARCREQIRWYDSRGRTARVLWRVSTVAVVVLAGITPLVHLVGARGWIEALPASVAALIAAVVAIWDWRTDWIRFKGTSERLKSELVKYETRTTDAYAASLPDEDALGAFVGAVEVLGVGETDAWAAKEAKRTVSSG